MLNLDTTIVNVAPAAAETNIGLSRGLLVSAALMAAGAIFAAMMVTTARGDVGELIPAPEPADA